MKIHEFWQLWASIGMELKLNFSAEINLQTRHFEILETVGIYWYRVETEI
jgi:hypothetical protein